MTRDAYEGGVIVNGELFCIPMRARCMMKVVPAGGGFGKINFLMQNEHFFKNGQLFCWFSATVLIPSNPSTPFFYTCMCFHFL